MIDWDDFQARVTPGDGIVARTPGAALVVPRPAPEQEALLEQLLTLVREAKPGGGRGMARKLAGLLATSDDDAMDLVLLAPLGGGDVAVLVVGDIEVRATGSEGAVVVSGRDSLTWVDRVLRGVTDLEVDTGGGASAMAGSDLVAGIVPGSGLTFAARSGAGIAAPAAFPRPAAPAAAEQPADPAAASPPSYVKNTPEQPAAVPADQVPGPPPPAPPVVPQVMPSSAPPSAPPSSPPPGDFQVESLTDDEAPARAPLPVDPREVTEQPTPAGTAPAQVKGVFCKRGHFNDPMVQFCTVCGINMVQQTPALVDGPRPPLGVLVFDDGSVFQLEQDYVLGRQPEQAPEVLSGRARPLRLEDTGGTVSRAHALIALEDWTVRLSDHGSANGTYIAMPNSPEWQPVPPNGRVVLTPGTTIKLGNRTLKYESHRGQR